MRQAKAILIAVLCVPLTACFEEPVQEHLHLTIRGDGSVVATVVQEVASSDRDRDNRELSDRLEESRETLAQNLDPWSQRFSDLEPLAEHQSIERVDGELRRSIRSAFFASFDDAVRLVEADGLTGNLVDGGGVAELNLFPTGGSRATYFQRQDADRRMDAWSAQLAEYLDAVVGLYTYLDRQPERAVPCLAYIFDQDEQMGVTGPLEPVEEELVERVFEAMEEVAAALMVPDGEAFSLNELTRLVYDPFPARLTVVVEADVFNATGFATGSGYFERPAVDIWNALRSLEGRWVAPDLVTAAAAPGRDEQQPDPDVLFLASQPRRYWDPPTSGEVESAILAELVPEELLQLRWRTPRRPKTVLDLPAEDWIEVMATAEAAVPN